MRINQLLKWLLVAILVLIVFLAVRLGISSAQKQKQAEVVLSNTQALKSGLEFFYADSDRFPTAAEFQDAGLMQPYFSAFPPQNLLSSACPQNSFVYKRPSLFSFELNFCLAADKDSFKQGWNKLVIAL